MKKKKKKKKPSFSPSLLLVFWFMPKIYVSMGLMGVMMEGSAHTTFILLKEGFFRNPLLILQLHPLYSRSWCIGIGVLVGCYKPSLFRLISLTLIWIFGMIYLWSLCYPSIFRLCSIKSFLLPHPMLRCIDALADFFVRPPRLNNAHGGVSPSGGAKLTIWTFGFLFWTFGSLVWIFGSILQKEEVRGFCFDGVEDGGAWWRQVMIFLMSRSGREMKLIEEVLCFSLDMFAMYLLYFLVFSLACLLFVRFGFYE